jgi:hypothetical protein
MIVAIIGLIATVVAAVICGLLNETYKRHLDAVATAAALAGELASYKPAFGMLDSSIGVLLKQAETGELYIPEQAPTVDTAYNAYVDKIGLLGPELAEDVAAVYGRIRGFRSALFPVTKRDRLQNAEHDVASLRVAHMFAQQASAAGDALVESLRDRARTPFRRHLWNTMHSVWSQPSLYRERCRSH